MLDILNDNKNTLNHDNCFKVLDLVENILKTSEYAKDFDLTSYIFHNNSEDKHHLVLKADAFKDKKNLNRIVIPFGATYSLDFTKELAITFLWTLPNWKIPYQERSLALTRDSIVYFNGKEDCHIA
jgi:hypothetical protein